MSDRPDDDRRARLRLVPSPHSTRGRDGAAPADGEIAVRDEDAEVAPGLFAEPSEDELRAAEALRYALAEGRGAAALRAAFSPATLSDDDHERILERALGAAAAPAASAALPLVVLAPAPSRAEERAAAALRTRVDAGLGRDPDAEPDDPIERLVEVAVALRSAHAPRALDELAEARIRKGALASPGRRLRAVVATIAALAVAAAAAFAIVPSALTGRGGSTTADLVPARSTQELFDPAEPFPREGGASARIDRISAARTADLRQNQFTRWGIR